MRFSPLNDPADHPLLTPWAGPLGTPPFDQVKPQDFPDAARTATGWQYAELRAIRDNPAKPDFDNTIAAMERSGQALARVRRLFWALSSAHSTPAMREIEEEMSTLLSAHETKISHDAALFERIAAVHASRHESGLRPDQVRLVESTYASFLRGGAGLTAEQKERCADIDARLSTLSVRFGHAVMAATGDWTMDLTEGDLDGLPPALVTAAANRADTAGQYRISLDRADYEGFLTFSARRDLRERLWRAFTDRCDGGPHDNWPVIAEILALRAERAQLLGYRDHAHYALEDSMAATPDAARALLDDLWEPARRRAAEEAAELQALIDAEAGGSGFALTPWDWRYYAERVRRDRYALDGGAIKTHLRLDHVRDAAFDTANRLYGLQFRHRPDIPTYHPDAWAWEVRGPDNIVSAVLLTDYLARPDKHGGAWMGSLRVQEHLDGDVRPIVYLVANFTPAKDAVATHLSLDEARTLFHEFGHALHGILSRVTYPSQSGTAVARDFVEFPSKFMENWIVSREVLSGFGVPDNLIDAIDAAESYGQGFATVELVSCALLDLAIHRSPDAHLAPKAFVEAELRRLGMPDAIGLRHRFPYFTHIFDGGYASAYYSYLWSEALDADAFEAFREAGDLFPPDLAARFRDEILAAGDSRDPMESYIAFRGRKPDGQALMRARHLIAT